MVVLLVFADVPKKEKNNVIVRYVKGKEMTYYATWNDLVESRSVKLSRSLFALKPFPEELGGVSYIFCGKGNGPTKVGREIMKRIAAKKPVVDYVMGCNATVSDDNELVNSAVRQIEPPTEEGTICLYQYEDIRDQKHTNLVLSKYYFNYAVTSPYCSAIKIGYSEDASLSRLHSYFTHLPGARFLWVLALPCHQGDMLDSQILSKLSDNRIPNPHGALTEWLDIPHEECLTAYWALLQAAYEDTEVEVNISALTASVREFKSKVKKEA